MTTKQLDIPSINVLGVRVHMAQMEEALACIEEWIQAKDACRYIVATGMHGVMEARKHPDFKAILNSADLFVADGISLVWVARLRGFAMRKRVSGSDLMSSFFAVAEEKGHRIFFYGDTDDTLEVLKAKLAERYPRLQIAGSHSPPFRPLTQEEDQEEVRIINESKADIIWVGLGLPKQERWIYEHRERLNVPVAVGVGAAFKFQSGLVRRAPAWLGDNGFEWLWRLWQEPRRVWRRVFLDGPRFAGEVALELTKLKKFD